MQVGSPAIIVENFSVTLTPRIDNKGKSLHIEASDRSSFGGVFSLNLNDDSIKSKTELICRNSEEMADILKIALKNENNCKSTLNLRDGVLIITITLLIFVRTVKFELELVQDKGENIEDKIERLISFIPPNSGDIFVQKHSNLDIFLNGQGIIKYQGGIGHESASTGFSYKSGKHYLQFKVIKVANNYCMIGVQQDLGALTPYPGHATFTAGKALYGANGHVYENGTSKDYTIGSFGDGYYVGVLLDATTNPHTVRFSINGRYGAILPLAGTSHYFIANIYAIGDAVELCPQFSWHKF